jgi:hypothetical protein
MADYEPGDMQLQDTFRRADKLMYERKNQLKQLKTEPVSSEL